LLGWGLEALFEACGCRFPADASDGSSQITNATNSLWVIAGSGTVRHQDTHGAQRFSKRRKKGIAEKKYYGRAAEAAAGGVASLNMCKKIGRFGTKASSTFEIHGTGTLNYHLSSVTTR